MTDETWGARAPGCAPLAWTPLWSDERHGRWQVEEATRESDGWTRPNLRLVLGEEEQRLTGAMCVCLRHDGPTPRVLLVEQDRPAPGVRLWEVPSGMVDEDDATPAESALRELGEETGVEARLVADLGEIYPDPGVFAASVQVVLAEATSAEATVPGAHADGSAAGGPSSSDDGVDDRRINDSTDRACGDDGKTGGDDNGDREDNGNRDNNTDGNASSGRKNSGGDGDSDEEGPEVVRARWFTLAEVDALIAGGGLRCGISLAALTLVRTWQQRP